LVNITIFVAVHYIDLLIAAQHFMQTCAFHPEVY